MVAICALATGVRAIPWREVFTPDGLLFFDGDSYYHMRRILYSIQHFPGVLETDPYMNFPREGVAPWPPGFDLPVAFFLRMIFGTEDVAALERAAAWIPVGLGTAAVAVTGLIGRRLAGPGAGLLAAGLLALLPVGSRYTRVGYVDHHAAIAAAGAVLLGGLVCLVEREDAGPRLWPLWAALCAAVLLFIWPGALIHLGIAQLVLLFWAIGAPTRSVAASRTLGLAAAHGLTALLLAPYGAGRTFAEFGDFTPLALTSFQPTYFGCAAASLAIAWGLWRKTAFGETRERRLGSALAVAGVGLVLRFLVIPELTQTLARSAGWFTGAEEFNRRIVELRPLFRGGPGGLVKARFYFSDLIFGFPIVWAIVAARRKEAGGRWALGVWSLAFALSTMSQERFMNTFAVAFCLVWAVACTDAWRWMAISSWGRPRSTLIGRALLVGMLVVALAPVVRDYARAREAFAQVGAQGRTVAFRNAAAFIGTHSAPAEAEDGSLAYGVLCAWGLGHMVRYHADRPVIQDNFGPYVARSNVEAANRYYAATDEGAALEILDRLKARYVIVDELGAGIPKAYPPASITGRMIAGRGSQGRGKGGARGPVLRALVHHRMVYESGSAEAPVRVFERVEGARVEGRAQPGTVILAEITLRSSMERFAYRTSVRAGPDGRYRLILPYPSEAFGAGVHPIGLYRIRTSWRSASLSVAESAVQAGDLLIGPSFAGEGEDRR